MTKSLMIIGMTVALTAVLTGVVLTTTPSAETPPAPLHTPAITPSSVAFTLSIPSVGINEQVVEGASLDNLSRNVVHMSETPFPGQVGNAVISAHRDKQFFALADITVGATLTISRGAGSSTWVLTRIRILDKQNAFVYNTEYSMLTLTTCWPIRRVGLAPQRAFFEFTQQ